MTWCLKGCTSVLHCMNQCKFSMAWQAGSNTHVRRTNSYWSCAAKAEQNVCNEKAAADQCRKADIARPGKAAVSSYRVDVSFDGLQCDAPGMGMRGEDEEAAASVLFCHGLSQHGLFQFESKPGPQQPKRTVIANHAPAAAQHGLSWILIHELAEPLHDDGKAEH